MYQRTNTKVLRCLFVTIGSVKIKMSHLSAKKIAKCFISRKNVIFAQILMYQQKNVASALLAEKMLSLHKF